MQKQKTQKRNCLKVYVFYWTNTRLGITDAGGIVHYPVEKRVVIAGSRTGAKVAFKKQEKSAKESALDGVGKKDKNRVKKTPEPGFL
ncbi:MAG: hypothetical protein Q8Q89_02395 [bacterium]|nr:hypothetical protein [bacterium]